MNGNTIDRVFITNTDQPKPVYHRINGAIENDDVGVKRIVFTMACGTQENPWGGFVSAHLRRAHADRFARPCRTCFRDG